MAKVVPFRGVRYDESVVGDLSNLTSPPYDVISPKDREHYHQLHPQNFVRLILGEELEGDTDSNNRFSRARAYMDRWLSEGVLKQDAEPAVYVYEQRFELEGKRRSVRGLVCAVRLHDYSDGVVLPHENTLAKPKSELIQLIRQTRANLDSIYGLYADPEGVLDELADEATRQRPSAQACDRDGVLHRMWSVSDPQRVGRVTSFLRDKQIAIADGHHRYETCLAYRDEMRSAAGPGEHASEYTLMTLVNVYQPDVTIYPTHRVVGGLPQSVMDNLENSLAELFEVNVSSRETILADMAERGAIGLYRNGAARTLKLAGDSSSLLHGSQAGRRLELNVLHMLILERSLGIDEHKLRNQTHLFYTRDPAEAIELVDIGRHQAAFLLNHIEVKSVLEVASAGERMPQKATYFYPKLLSGLVFRKMD